MAFPTVTDRNVQYPRRVSLTEVSTGVYDVEAVPGNVVAEGTPIDAALFSAIFSAVYPVGSIYTTTNTTAPATLFGFGTWEAYGVGKVLVGIDGTQAEFDTIGETGGAKTHALSANELPHHTHAAPATGNYMVWTGTGGGVASTTGSNMTSVAATGDNTSTESAHNNLQPYQVVYMWRRTA